jgi:hypothetical protein
MAFLLVRELKLHGEIEETNSNAAMSVMFKLRIRKVPGTWWQVAKNQSGQRGDRTQDLRVISTTL